MVRMNQWNAFSATQTRHKTQHHYYSATESDEDLVGNPPSVVSSQASSIRGRPMTRGGRRGRNTSPSRGSHQQTDLDETPHDSSVSPPHQIRHHATTEGKPSNANEKKDKKASTIAKKLHENYTCIFGAPVKLHSDQRPTSPALSLLNYFPFWESRSQR